MTKNTTSPLGLLAIALFAVTGIVGGGPLASFVDCSDSFWAVTCGHDEAPTLTGNPSPSSSTADATPADEETRRIDNDPVCTAVTPDLFNCHT